MPLTQSSCLHSFDKFEFASKSINKNDKDQKKDFTLVRIFDNPRGKEKKNKCTF